MLSNSLIRLPGIIRKFAVLSIDTGCVLVCAVLAWLMRLDFATEFWNPNLWWYSLWSSALYFTVWVFSSLKVQHIRHGLLGFENTIFSCLTLFVIGLEFLIGFGVISAPRSVPLIQGLLLIFFLFGWRKLAEIFFGMGKAHPPACLVAAYITDSKDIDLLGARLKRSGLRLSFCIAPDGQLAQRYVFGRPVVDFSSVDEEQIRSIQLMLVSNSDNLIDGNRRKLLELSDDHGFGIDFIAGSDSRSEGLRKGVSYSDFLNRAVIDLQTPLDSSHICLVTGGGGSIGSVICKRLVISRIRTLVILDNSEYNLFKLKESLKESCLGKGAVDLVFVLGSVNDEVLIDGLFMEYQFTRVYHAAAVKHVGLVQENIRAALSVNVLGTLIIGRAVERYRVPRMILISSDKAVRPTGVMGASKRLAELVMAGLQGTTNDSMFCAVRFGNVLGSSGSVVPIFMKRVEEGKHITIHHPDLVRFFMVIDEAANLVVQAGELAKTGCLYVLDMGEPVKILSLAKRVIRLSGRHESSVEIRFGNLASHEKLYEELLVSGELLETSNPKVLESNDFSIDRCNFGRLQSELPRVLHRNSSQEMMDLLTSFVSIESSS